MPALFMARLVHAAAVKAPIFCSIEAGSGFVGAFGRFLGRARTFQRQLPSESRSCPGGAIGGICAVWAPGTVDVVVEIGAGRPLGVEVGALSIPRSGSVAADAAPTGAGDGNDELV